MTNSQSSTTPQATQYCGYVGILGRTNVGKSTLLNNLMQQKLCITSSKPQTTRNRILGIKTDENYQAIYIDTPGLHRKAKRRLNQRMNRQAYNTIEDVDAILFVIEPLKWSHEEMQLLSRAQSTGKPIILVINKIDTLNNKEALLPFLDELQKKHTFKALIPICARRNNRIHLVEDAIKSTLPPGKHLFSKDTITDCSDTFLIAEIIREKLMRQLHQELPYSLMVEVEQLQKEKQRFKISALIWVETPGQKAILIGKAGEQLKTVGQQARLAIENLFKKKVHLSLWVKVKKGWPDNDPLLNRQGL